MSAKIIVKARRRKRRRWPLLLAALIAWYELDKREDEERRVQESHYDLTRYTPRRKVL